MSIDNVFFSKMAFFVMNLIIILYIERKITKYGSERTNTLQ